MTLSLGHGAGASLGSMDSLRTALRTHDKANVRLLAAVLNTVPAI